MRRFPFCTLVLFMFGATVLYGSEVISFGEVTSRDNNLASPAYQSQYGGWSETRLVFGSRLLPKRPRLYLKTNLALSSETIAEENTASSGLGVEFRPLAGNQYLQNHPFLEWLPRARCYAEYLGQSSIQGNRQDWNPHQDVIVGFDVWREYGALSDIPSETGSKYWGQLYLGAAYHTTNFYIDQYRSIRAGINAKAGVRYPTASLPVMPYVVLDVNTTTGHSFFWENRMIGGVGVRTEFGVRPNSKWTLYAEQDWLFGYLKDRPSDSDGVPNHDQRIGLCYQVNRY